MTLKKLQSQKNKIKGQKYTLIKFNTKIISFFCYNFIVGSKVVVNSMKIVIVENDEKWQKRTIKNVNKALITEDTNEKICSFNRYTKELKNIIYDNSKKIYILDIELGEYSGYDIAREIRDCANDWESIIIISSIYNQKENIISDRLSILTYISKLIDFDNNIKESVKLALKIIYRDNFFEFKESGINNKIAIKDIKYIKKEKYSKYCTIKTIEDTFRVRDTIINLKEKTKLTQVKKDLLINKKYIKNKKEIEKIRNT